ncbi:MAG TPA: hypothetical protein VM597_08425 [Gemmataceae bacterium]|jgi:hypothetical protein|nr:hypothetical protein [Gemmataceae bacterium]
MVVIVGCTIVLGAVTADGLPGFGDPKRKAHWGEQAKRLEAEAELTKEVREGVQTKAQMTAFLLANQLRDELGKAAGATKGDDLQAELVGHSPGAVNWKQLVEDLMDSGR